MRVPLFDSIAPGELLNTEKLEYFAVCIRDAFGGMVLVYALDSGPFRGLVDGVMGLPLVLLSGLLSGYSAHFYGS